MQKRIISELRMLRGVAYHFLPLHTCYFCHKALLELPADYTPGHCTPPPIKDKVTEHHIDGNHENNAPGNRAMCHQSCHKAYHMKDVGAKYRAAKKKSK